MAGDSTDAWCVATLVDGRQQAGRAVSGLDGARNLEIEAVNVATDGTDEIVDRFIVPWCQVVSVTILRAASFAEFREKCLALLARQRAQAAREAAKNN
jgi:hypothetical protein